MSRFILLTIILLNVLFLTMNQANLIRRRRQWKSDHHYEPDPYGPCGKPTMYVPNGGFDLYDSENYLLNIPTQCTSSIAWLECEPVVYCDNGYKFSGDVDLVCQKKNSTYEWVGPTPICIRRDEPTNDQGNNDQTINSKIWNHEPDPYGPCGKPTMYVPNGGFDLYSENYLLNIPTQCTSSIAWLECEPVVYCDNGYKFSSDVDLVCQKKNSTYEWVGPTPICIRDDHDRHSKKWKIVGISVGLSLALTVCAGLVRGIGNKQGQRQRRANWTSTPPTAEPASPQSNVHRNYQI